MANIKIAFINASTLITDADAKKVMAALSIQVTRDFAPVWGIDADLVFYTRKQNAPDDHWWLVILDNPDAAGAYGYHDLTPKGLPIGKIFSALDIQEGSPWSITASHELLEMLGDPTINLMASRHDGPAGTVFYSYEVCDACEDDSFAYKINGVPVSDFVYPSYFEQIDHPKNTKFDFQNEIKKPFELLKGGYTSIYKVNSSEGWTQLDAKHEDRKYKMRGNVGSRRERRRTPRDKWLHSDPKKIKASREKG